MSLRNKVFFTALVTMFSGWCSAGETSDKDLWLMAKYDVDGDQVISMNEVSNKREKLFGYMDSDQSGSVSFTEYRDLDMRKRELLLKARFEKLDLDSDGHLSNEEYASFFGSFDRFDRNGDGKITTREITKNKSQKQPAAVSEDDNVHCLLWVCVKTKLK